MSDIFGQGFGDDHDWQAGWTTPAKMTPYKCRRCGETWAHSYDITPQIHKAMQESGRVSEHCSGPSAPLKP